MIRFNNESVTGQQLCINITVIDDNQFEMNETILFSIGSPKNGRIGNVSSTVVTILDNDIGLIYLKIYSLF